MESKPFNTETLDQLLRQGIPGFGDAFIDRVMDRLNKISPIQSPKNHPALEKSDLAKLKYSILVQIEKKESAKLKPWMSMEVSVVQIKNELLKEKLVEKADDRFEITELGRRFMREFKQVKESEK